MKGDDTVHNLLPPLYTYEKNQFCITLEKKNHELTQIHTARLLELLEDGSYMVKKSATSPQEFTALKLLLQTDTLMTHLLDVVVYLRLVGCKLHSITYNPSDSDKGFHIIFMDESRQFI